MDFRAPSQEVGDKENQGVPEKFQDGELPRVVSILKSSQRANCPLEKKLTKVSFKNSPARHTIPHKREENTAWEDIRKLDEEQNWTERTQVVTKEEHNFYTETAKELLDQLIADLPCFRGQSGTAINMTTNADHPEIDESEMSVSNIMQGSEGHQNGPNDDLDTELMSDFSKLQINSNDCPRTFSPIGSDRASPDEQENFIDSNEDINKLLAPHENGNVEDDVLSTGNAHTDNLLKEITSEEHSYKSAELFSVNPSELENEFQERNTLNEDVISGEKTEDVQALFEKDAVNQVEVDDQFGDEAFKPASEAMWELDYLEQCGNNSEDFQMSALARQSLYVKFDPLVKGGNSQTPVKRGVGMRNMAPQKPLSMGDNLLFMDSPAPSARTSVLQGSQTNEDQTLLEQADSPCGVDKLLNFSPSEIAKGTKTEIEEEEEDIIVGESNNIVETHSAPEISNIEVKEEEAPRDKVRLFTQEELDAAVKKETEALRKQALFRSKDEFAAAVKKETETLRQQMEEEATIREMESKELTERNEQLRRETGELRVVMQEYEKTIADMIEKNQKSQDQFNHSTSEVAKERDQLQSDLTAVETAFSDLHRRYEKLKGVVENFKKNEEILKKATTDYQEKLKRSEEKYRMLKKHAEEKIESANIEIARVRKSNESEIAVMKAALKKEQTKSASLEMSLQQKISENAELTSICDELINKMGGQRS